MRVITFLLGLLLVISCGKDPQDNLQESNLSEFAISQKHAEVLPLIPSAAKKVDEWNEYRMLKQFLAQFESISPNEALNNSRELNRLVESMKDSVMPKFLEKPSFQARVNLMHNETLRLYDMSSISAIKYSEVNAQVTKVLEAFSTINSKINTILQQEELDIQVDDPKFNRLFPDSISEEKVDLATPKNSKLQVSPKKKETQRERTMRLSKEDRLKKRQLKLQEIKKKKDGTKKEN